MSTSGDAPPAKSLQLRKEIFALGGRHRGDPLAGAVAELKEDGLSAERRELLRAVITHLSSKSSGQQAAPTPSTASDQRYVLIIAAASVIAALQLWSLFH